MILPEFIDKNDILIVTPIYQTDISSDELYSLKHIIHYLKDHTRIIIAPDNLEISLEGFQIKYFPAKFFEGIKGYNQLLLSREFYEGFSQYKYILIVQLDALILSDRLLDFCELGFDYIGAPWFKSSNNPEEGFLGSGNGGLSLRSIPDFINVFDSQLFLEANFIQRITDISHFEFNDLQENNSIIRYLKIINIIRQTYGGIDKYLQQYKWNEDKFWANRAKLFTPEFTVASPKISLDFAFEMFPRYCYEQNNQSLPFGAHAWFKYDKDFWKPYLCHNITLQLSIKKRK